MRYRSVKAILAIASCAYFCENSSDSDPHWFHGFISVRIWIRIRIRVKIQGLDQNWKNLQMKKINIFWIKISIYVFVGLRKAYKLQEKPLALKKRTFRHFKIFYFCGSFLSSWIRIKPTKICADPSGPGSENGGKQCWKHTAGPRLDLFNPFVPPYFLKLLI